MSCAGDQGDRTPSPSPSPSPNPSPNAAGYPLLEMKESGYLGHLRRADKVIPRGVDRRQQRHSASQRGNEREREERKRTRTRTKSAQSREVRRRSSAPVESEVADGNYVRGLCVETRALI